MEGACRNISMKWIIFTTTQTHIVYSLFLGVMINEVLLSTENLKNIIKSIQNIFLNRKINLVLSLLLSMRHIVNIVEHTRRAGMKQLHAGDRSVRVIIGVSLLVIAFSSPITPLTLAAYCLSAMYPLLTALVAWDPFYSMMLSIIEKIESIQLMRHKNHI